MADRELCISLYKIATRVAEQIIETNGKGIAEHIDETLGNFPDAEILPSRILLYGAQPQNLEEVKRELLRYPWQSKPNFMHFPKIECISSDVLVESVSYAGASELATSMKEEELESVVSVSASISPEQSKNPEKIEDKEQERESHVFEQKGEIAEEDIMEHVYDNQHIKNENISGEEQKENNTEESVSNVMLVDPESLGFSTQKVVRMADRDERGVHNDSTEEEEEFEMESSTASSADRILSRVHDFLSRMTKSIHISWLTSSIFPVIGVFAILAIGFFSCTGLFRRLQ